MATGVAAITSLECKDCGSPFVYSSEAASRDERDGRTSPERCPTCRPLHRREYQKIGLSHVDVIRLRDEGVGGLGKYRRPPRIRELIEPQPFQAPSFPIEPIVERLIANIKARKAQIHVVVGPTGSGKSTWLPLRLLREDDIVRRGPIVVTQPRIPATEGPARFVGKMVHGRPADEHHDHLVAGPGLAVGYRHSLVGESRTDSANRLVYLTDGTLLSAVSSAEIGRYSVVMIDEAHERNRNIDSILGLLRDRLRQFPQLHLIIASATVDAATFVRLFEQGGYTVETYVGEGFTYPILDLFSDDAVAHLPPAAAAQVAWRKLEADPADSAAAKAAVAEADARLLGPLPCWVLGTPRSDGEPHPLRYYPQFEALVHTGDGRVDPPPGASGAAWSHALELLTREHQTARPRWPEDQSTAATRANDFPKKLQSFATEAVIRIIEREIEEAPRRRERWSRRDQSPFSWPRLGEPRVRGHILVFLATNPAIDACMKSVGEALEQLYARYPAERGNNLLCPFSRDRDEGERDEVSRDWLLSDPRRKIVFGTNLAETSLTLDGLVHVVDTGLINEESYSRAKRDKEMLLIPHSQAGRRQRIGRVGRKEPGESRRLYTRTELRRAPRFTRPQIERTSGVDVLLDLAAAGVQVDAVSETGAPEIGGIHLLSLPDASVMAEALAAVRRDGALTAEGDLTPLGAELRGLRIEPFAWRRLLVDADRLGLLWETAVFLAFTKLPDAKGRGGKRSLLFCPDAIEDEGEDADTEDADDANDPRAPYRDAFIAVRHGELRAAMLDDLELYLSAWQGWFRTPVDRRDAWARDMGLSLRALAMVARTLGVDPGTAREEQGWLPHFYAFDQKGVMSRDVRFERLDVVRHLLALHLAKAAAPRFEFRRDSTWHGRSTFQRQREPERTLARFLPLKDKEPPHGQRGGPHVYGDVVWLDPAWKTDRLPAHVVELARLLAETHGPLRLSERAFANGAALTNLPTPRATIEIPTLDEIKAWLARRATEIATKAVVDARVVHVVGRNVFVQLDDGAIIPIEEGADGHVGETVHVRLVGTPRDVPVRLSALPVKQTPLPQQPIRPTAAAPAPPPIAAHPPPSSWEDVRDRFEVGRVFRGVFLRVVQTRWGYELEVELSIAGTPSPRVLARSNQMVLDHLPRRGAPLRVELVGWSEGRDGITPRLRFYEWTRR